MPKFILLEIRALSDNPDFKSSRVSGFPFFLSTTILFTPVQTHSPQNIPDAETVCKLMVTVVLAEYVDPFRGLFFVNCGFLYESTPFFAIVKPPFPGILAFCYFQPDQLMKQTINGNLYLSLSTSNLLTLEN